MSDAKICDRCGKVYTKGFETPWVEMAKALQAYANALSNKVIPNCTNDLCEDCEKSFKKWWKEGED